MNLNDMGNGKMSTQLQVIFKLILIFSLFAIPLSGIAQYSFEHYIPPFYNGSSNNGDIGRHTVVLSTLSKDPIDVHIKKGDGTHIASVKVSRFAPYEYVFKIPNSNETYGNIPKNGYPHTYNFPYGVVGADRLNEVLIGEGLYLYSPDNQAPFCVNIRHVSGAQGGSLTSKGLNAYGKAFRSGHVYTDAYHAAERRSHFISVMAVEDCEVTFTDIKCGYLTKFNGVDNIFLDPVSPTDKIKIPLIKGQSYIIGVDHDAKTKEGIREFKGELLNKMNGTSITSTGKIVVTSGSWTSGPDDGQDMGFDQIVPVDELRDQYVVMRGEGRDNTTERPIVVATKDGTEIWVNGVHKNPATPLAAGEFYIVDDFFEESTPTVKNDNLFIDTKDKNVYVYQTMSGDKSVHGPTVGMNFIPPITTLGLNEVVVPMTEFLAGKKVQQGVVTILALKDANIKYERNYEGTVTTHEVNRELAVEVPEEPKWVSYTLDNLKGTYRFYSNKAINVAWVVRDGYVGAAGYYSGFTKGISKVVSDLEVNVETDLSVLCESYNDEKITIRAQGSADIYEWYVNDLDSELYSNSKFIEVNVPDEETVYYVLGYYQHEINLLYNGEFENVEIEEKGSIIGFNSEYDITWGNLTEQGDYTISTRTQNENAELVEFGAIEDTDESYVHQMFMAYSKDQGDVIYKVDEFPVDENSNYIFKIHGRLAIKDDAKFFDQSLMVTINQDTVISNFLIDDTSTWKFDLGLWNSGDDRKANIKVINQNLSGKDAIFAFDSISFTRVVQDTAEFVALVVPNISTVKDDEYHFCKGTKDTLDVSNGDTSWYDYSWAKKDDETGEYINLENTADITGVNSSMLIFNQLKKSEEGVYRCTVGFNEDYQKCGPSDITTVDLTVYVDEDAEVSISGDTHTCLNAPVKLQASVKGDQEILKWYIGESKTPVQAGKDRIYEFSSDTPGMHTVKCIAENGCGTSSAEISIEVFAYPNSTVLVLADQFCEGAEITMEANALLDGNGSIKYYWKRGTEKINHFDAVYSFASDIEEHQGEIYSVEAVNVYVAEGESFECRSGDVKKTDPLKIIPDIQLTPLEPVTSLCEEKQLQLVADVKGNEGDYNFKWYKNDFATDNETSTYLIGKVGTGDAGTYKVEVWSDCDRTESSTKLIVDKKMVVHGVSFNEEGPFCSPTDVTVTFNDNGAVTKYRIIDPYGVETEIPANTSTFEVNTTGKWQFIAEGKCSNQFSKVKSFKMISSFGDPTMEDVTVCPNTQANFKVKFADDVDESGLTFTWFDNKGNSIEESSSSLSIEKVLAENLGEYTCVVTDGHDCVGSTKTVKANLAIYEESITTSGALSIEKCEGEKFELSIEYTGSPKFEWSFENKAGVVTILDKLTGSLTINSVDTDDAGIYTCKVSNFNCIVDKIIERELVVHENISITNPDPENFDICEGAEQELSIEIDGSEYTLEWYDDSNIHIEKFDNKTLVKLSALAYSVTPYTYTAKVVGLGDCGDLEKKYNVQVHEKPKLEAIDPILACEGDITITADIVGTDYIAVEWWNSDETTQLGTGNNYTIKDAIHPDSEGTYIAKLTTKSCGDMEVSAIVDVINNIEVTDQSPATTSVCEDGSITLFVTANAGDDEIHYKWTQTSNPTKEFPNLPTIELNDVKIGEDDGEYTCEVSNDLNCDNQTLTFNVVINENPSITDPISKVICETESSIKFEVSGSAEGDENYQWYKNEILIPGATSNIYIENTPENGNTYYCTVSGSIGDCVIATSNKATLTIIQKVAVTNPDNLTINDGADATFSVTASGEKEYSYQWEIWNGSDWEPVAGAKYSGINSAELKITNALKADFDGNQYRCVVTSDGTVCSSIATSDEAILTINSVNKIVSAGQPVNQVVCEGEDFTFSITGTKTTGLTYQWQYHKGDDNFTNAKLETDIEVSTYTISGATQGMENWEFRCLVSDGVSTTQASNEVSVDVWENIVVTTPETNNLTLCEDIPLILSVDVTSGENVKFEWIKSGNATVLHKGSVLNLDNAEKSEAGTYICKIYNDQSCGNIDIEFNVTVQENAKVTLHPDNAEICESDVPVTFNADGTAEGTVDFEWHDKDGNIVGTDKTLTIAANPENGQSYYCVISGDACNSATTNVANLTVFEEVVITDPSDQTASDGEGVTFTVSATGEPTIEYKWYEKTPTGTWIALTEGDIYSGVSTASLTVNPVSLLMNANQYKCEAWSTTCSEIDESAAATLTILAVNKIALQPSDQVVCEGKDIAFTVTGTKAIGLTYQWQYHNGDNNYIDSYLESDVLVSTYTIPNATQAMEVWGVRCIVSDGGVSTAQPSNEVSVDVWENIAVSTVSPTPIVVCEDLPLSLSVDVTAGEKVKFAWTKTKDKDGNLTGDATVLQTGSVLNLGSAELTEAGTYNCKVHNDQSCGDTDIVFNVTVQENAKIILHPANAEICESVVPVIFEADGTAEGTTNFEWRDKNGDIVGTDKTLTIPANPENGQSYYCIVSGDACATATTNVANLTVYEEVEITDPANQTVSDGEDATFTVTATGEPIIKYQWYENPGTGTWSPLTNGGIYSGVNTAILQVDPVSLSMNTYEYKCEAWSSTCAAKVESDPAIITVNALIKIYSQPTNLQACMGDDVEFEITGTSEGLTYEWEYSTNGVDYNPISAEPSLTQSSDLNGSKLKITSVRDEMKDWTFHCIVKDHSSEDDISNKVKVEVFTSVDFDAIDDLKLCADESKQITLSGVSGTNPYTYSWFNGEGDEVSTTAILSIGATDNGKYKVIVGNGGVCPDKPEEFAVHHHEKLSLQAWVNDSEMCTGSSQTLSVGIDNIDPELSISYQWYNGDDKIDGENNADYTFTPVDKNESGLYKVEVYDGKCNTESVSGYVDMFIPINKVNAWNKKETLCVGTELNLEVDVTGDVKSYTWTHNGNSITATTNYLVASVTDADKGTYQCIVEDHCGNMEIYTTEIIILDIPSIDGVGIENLTAVCEGDPLEIGPITITGSNYDIEWTLNDGSSNTTAGEQLDLGAASIAMEGNYEVEVSNKCGSDASIGTQVVNPTPTLDPIDDQIVCQGEDVIFRANATGRDLHYKWIIYEGGVGIEQKTTISTLLMSGSDVMPADEFTPGTYTIECIVSNDNDCGISLTETAQLIVNPSTILNATLKNVVEYVGNDYTMTIDVTGTDLNYEWTHEKNDGTKEALGINEPSIEFKDIQMSDAGYYNCIVTGACGTRLASGKLTVKEPVKITEDLTSLEEKCDGEALRLSISTSGQVETIKWFKEVGGVTTELAETGSSLYFSELTLDDAATYTCEITGEGIDVLKQSCIVRVYPITTLIAPIGNQTICEGEELNWIPEVSGAADLKYKWLFDGTMISADKILHYDALTLSQEGDYEVQVTGMCGNVSNSGNLEVIKLPAIVSVSENLEVCENTSLVEFIVEATGENVKYQWRKNGTDMAGKTSPVLSLTSIQLEDDANYSCKVYNACADVISTDIKLRVKPQLVIVKEPVDVEVCAGEEVIFTTEIDGINPTYQWKFNGTAISGATTPTYSISVSDLSDKGYYTCIVTDECTSSRSTKPAELIVNPLPDSGIFGRMVLCAKEDRVTYVTNQIGDDIYGWDVDGGIFAGPEDGTRTRITWNEVANGQLSILITDTNTGCKSRVDSLVTLNALPEVKLEVFTSRGVCEESFELSGGYPAGGIYWVNGISEETFDPADKGPGEYTIHYSYTDKYGCSNVTETTSLKVDELPTVDITDDTTIGSCSPFTLVADTKEENIKWSPADNLDDVNSMTPIFTPGESQVYVASVMDEHGCVGIDLVNLNVAPLPEVNTIEDITAGQCNELQLLTDIVGDAGEITWTNPDHLDDPTTRSPRIVNAPEGTYTYKINVVDLYGCDAGDEVTVSIVADPELDEDKFGCEGDQFEVNLTGMDKPIWDDGYAGDTRTVETPGKYTLTVENEYGCGDKQNFVINPTPNPKLMDYLIIDGPDEVEIVEGKPVIIFEGQTLTLGSNLPLEYSPYNFTWEDGKEGSILQRYDVTETGLYKLTVVDNLGCVAKDSVDVEVKPVGIEQPSAFTPNSNNENDRFYLKDINYDIQKYEMYVYDRWGELLFIGSEPGYNGGWDGQYKGKLCPTGAYVWMLFINGDLTNKGTFMLIR